MRSFFTILLLLNLNQNLYAGKIEHKSCEIGVPVFTDWNVNSTDFSDFNHQLYQLKGTFKEMYDIAVNTAKEELLEKGYRVYYVNIPAKTLFSQTENEAFKNKSNSNSKNKLYFSYKVNFNSKEEYRIGRNKKKADARSTVEIYYDKNLLAMKSKELKSNLFSSKKWQVLLKKSLKRSIQGLPDCRKI